MTIFIVKNKQTVIHHSSIIVKVSGVYFVYGYETGYSSMEDVKAESFV